MFTGIITATAKINAITQQAGGIKLSIDSPYDTSGIALGASIAHNGVCLTVISKQTESYEVELSQETLDCTTAASWQQGQKLNVEQALKVGDELGGHIVSGHVDGVGEVVSITALGAHYEVKIKAPEALQPFIAAKGSITVDGVSLTVNALEGDLFLLNIIPHTWEHTMFHHYEVGSQVNLEIDMLARYVARLQELRR